MSPQESIAHYLITAKIGAGGMGEVYRATDTKLHREVAIKIIPDSFANDEDRMARFTREAQVLASLNHPGIAGIYGVEDRALVMELVPGPTLAERIAAGPIAFEDALPIARQIAEALEYAHDHGVIHRDLKPANIKITPDGRVKILDFGLAKALSSDTAAADPKASPTLTMRATLAGVIMGTAAYMSPEQARGQAVDKRADIWAFGVVLNEMLTGRSLFEGATVSDTLAAVLRADLDWSELPAGLPANLHAVLRRCLERDPKRRLRDIGDARLDLEQTDAAPAAHAPTASRPSKLGWIAAALLGIVALSLAAVHFRETQAAGQLIRFTLPPPDRGSFFTWLSISPDGRHLAFTAAGPDGASRLWVRSLESLESRPLPGTDGTVTAFWSPDSRFVAFQSGGRLKKLDMSGGPPQTLCNTTGVVLGGTWNRDGVIIFGNNGAPLMQVSSAGGVATPITRLEVSRQEGNHSDPVFLSDGRHFLYLRRSSTPENHGIFVGDLRVPPEQQPLNRVQLTEFSPGYVPAADGGKVGHLLFLRDGTLMVQSFDERRFATIGEPAPIVEQVGSSISRGYFSASNGVLVYRTGGAPSSELAWHDQAGRRIGNAGGPDDYGDIAVAPDASRVVYSRMVGAVGAGTPDLWVLDIARGIQSRLTVQPDGARAPVWSRDGKYVAYTNVRGPGKLIVKAPGSATAERVLFRSASGKFVTDWSRDGRFLVYTDVSTKTAADVYAIADPLTTADPKPIPVVVTEFNDAQGQISPDGHWLAYSSNEAGRYDIYVRPFPPDEARREKWVVSSAGGLQPRWRADGKELFYFSPDRRFMAVDIHAGNGFQAGTPRPLFESPLFAVSATLFRYDVSPDGKRFLLILPTAGAAAAPVTVVLNWESALKRQEN